MYPTNFCSCFFLARQMCSTVSVTNGTYWWLLESQKSRQGMRRAPSCLWPEDERKAENWDEDVPCHLALATATTPPGAM